MFNHLPEELAIIICYYIHQLKMSDLLSEFKSKTKIVPRKWATRLGNSHWIWSEYLIYNQVRKILQIVENDIYYLKRLI